MSFFEQMKQQTQEQFNQQQQASYLLPSDLNTVVEEHPCPFMDKYIDRSLLQFASQEIQHTAYRQGSVVDDLSDNIDLDFEF